MLFVIDCVVCDLMFWVWIWCWLLLGCYYIVLCLIVLWIRRWVLYFICYFIMLTVCYIVGGKLVVCVLMWLFSVLFANYLLAFDCLVFVWFGLFCVWLLVMVCFVCLCLDLLYCGVYLLVIVVLFCDVFWLLFRSCLLGVYITCCLYGFWAF